MGSMNISRESAKNLILKFRTQSNKNRIVKIKTYNIHKFPITLQKITVQYLSTNLHEKIRNCTRPYTFPIASEFTVLFTTKQERSKWNVESRTMRDKF